jgi:uncharacterized RDD family membrane protein YckC
VSLDNTAEVETPEHIRFRYRVAGPTWRALAYLIDLVIRGVILSVAALVLFAGGGQAVGERMNRSTGLFMVMLFVLEWGYYVFFETVGGGASPGKRALSLRVVKEGGFPIGFLDSVLRNLLRAADFLPVGYVLGLVVMAGDRRYRRLGDRVGGTMVVIEEKVGLGAALSISPPPTADELAALPQHPRLSAAERDSLEMLLRRKALSDARRLELADMIAPVLARRMGVALRDPVRFLALLYHRSVEATPRPGGRP